jgi:hypothetical protein
LHVHQKANVTLHILCERRCDAARLFHCDSRRFFLGQLSSAPTQAFGETSLVKIGAEP